MKNFIKVFSNKDNTWNYNNQQDTQEFIGTKFFEFLGEENNENNNINNIADKLPYSEKLKEKTKDHFKNLFYYSIINKLFNFFYLEEITCFKNEQIVYKDKKFVTNNILQLSMTTNKEGENIKTNEKKRNDFLKKNLNLNDLINNFNITEEYKKKERNEYGCGNNNKTKIEKDKVEKKISFQTLPGIGEKGYLMIHLKRFANNISKLTNKVSFPLELSLKSIEKNNKDVNFRLYAFINQIGKTIHGGHYISVIKTNDGWFEMDDLNVKSKNESEVLNNYQESVYVLFYERI